MALHIKVRVQGDRAVKKKLETLRRVGFNLGDAMKEVGDKAVDYYANDSFATKGRVFGSAWQDLTPAYKKWKEKKYAGRGVLQLTGDMQSGFFAQTDSNSAVIDNHSPVYKYHQSTAPRTKMPRRQMAGINEPIKRIVKGAVRKDIERQLR